MYRIELVLLVCNDIPETTSLQSVSTVEQFNTCQTHIFTECRWQNDLFNQKMSGLAGSSVLHALFNKINCLSCVTLHCTVFINLYIQ